VRKEDKVDPAAGLLLRKRVGDDVRAGEVLAELHARDGERLEAGAMRLRTAALIDASPPAPRALLIDRIA
jgi:thymidine phosphorylase